MIASQAAHRDVILWIWEAVLDNARLELETGAVDIATLHDRAHDVLCGEPVYKPCPKR